MWFLFHLLFCFSKLLTNAGMECSLYVFLLTLFTSHYKLSKSSSLSPNPKKEVTVQQISYLYTAAANKEIQPFGIVNSNCQSYNRFEHFSSWTCNAPQVAYFASALLVIKPSTTIQKYRYRLLVLGGISTPETNNPVSNDLNPNQTWIYYEETNSWQMIANVADEPPATMISFQLATLCSSRAIIVSVYVMNSTWIFLLDQLTWKRVTIVGNGPSLTDIRHYVFAVAVNNVYSLCSCTQDVFVFYRSDEGNHFVMYKLSCVIEHTTYRWEKVGNYTIPWSRRVYLVRDWSEKTTVLALVDECIWKFSVEKSIWNKTKHCLPYASWLRVADDVAQAFFVNDTREILLISIGRLLVIGLSISDGVSFVDQIKVDDPIFKRPRLFSSILLVYEYAVRVVSRGKRLQVKYYFPALEESCGSSTWNLQRRDGERSWHFVKMNDNLLIPSDYGFQSFWKDGYYRIVFPSYDIMSTPPAMWSMNLRSTQWQMEGYLNVTGISIREMMGSDVVIMNRLENVWLIVSTYSTTLITSKDDIRQISAPMPSRSEFTVVTIYSSSALLFGGRIGDDVALNDLWKFSLAHRIWKKVKMIEPAGRVPSPRYGHVAAVIGDDMFVFGGYNYSGNFNVELWKYSVINNSWRLQVPTNKLPHFTFDPCYFTATAQTGMLWIGATCVSYSRTWNFDGHFELWLFIVHLQTWNFVAIQNLKNTPYNYRYSPLDFWRGYLLTLEHFSLVYLKARCPYGLGSSNISRVPCDVCKVGFYSDLESNECLKCPNGTTTRKERSSRPNDCNVCVKSYCRHGRCLVVSNGLTNSPVCTCDVGFTGSRCQDATYYYIGTAVILVIGIIAFVVIVLWRIIKKRKQRETALRRHIKILNDAWQISWQEIILQGEVGGGASGRVWKAQYRDIDVAVKMMIDDDDSQSSLEFAEEIKFMQTLRHRNIILFIGAGKTSPQAQPFLVVEFAQRGSLRHVLADANIEINSNRKMDFALDASKGMEYLHKLDPPRIHRDLKSENLLVSQSWIVKVADFGLGRLFCGAHKNRQSNQSSSFISNDSDNEFLLDMRDFSDDGIGTVRWSAPELARRERYNGSIDVYRYWPTSI